MVCGNVTGNPSDPISIVFYELTHNSETNTAVPYIIIIGFLIATLLVCEVVSITAIAIILRRSKAKINAALESHAAAETTHCQVRDEPMYEDVTGPLPSVSVINTQDSVAYGHTKTTTLKDSQH